MAKKQHYVDAKKLEIELIRFSESFKKDVQRVMTDLKITDLKAAEKKSQGFISEELGEMFLKVAYNLANKHNFSNYTYKEEMIGLGIEYLCRFAKKFDKTKKNANAFAYCTQICTNGFLQAMEKEKKKANFKDKLIKEAMRETELERWTKKERGSVYENDDNW